MSSRPSSASRSAPRSADGSSGSSASSASAVSSGSSDARAASSAAPSVTAAAPVSPIWASATPATWCSSGSSSASAGSAVEEREGALVRLLGTAVEQRRLREQRLDQRGVDLHAERLEARERVLEQLDGLAGAAGPRVQAPQQRGDERDAVLVLRAAPDLQRAAQQRLGLLQATLVGEHLADVAVRERLEVDVAGAPARVAALAVERHRFVPAPGAVREAAHVVEHGGLAVGGAVTAEDLERAGGVPGLGCAARHRRAPSRGSGRHARARAPRRQPRRPRSPGARAGRPRQSGPGAGARRRASRPRGTRHAAAASPDSRLERAQRPAGPAHRA